jgi:hypothetical protein
LLAFFESNNAIYAAVFRAYVSKCANQDLNNHESLISIRHWLLYLAIFIRQNSEFLHTKINILVLVREKEGVIINFFTQMATRFTYMMVS